MTILHRIIETKHKEVDIAKRRRPIARLQAAIRRAEPPRDFLASILPGSGDEVRLIGELKKASPSAGLIVPEFDPVAIARTYAAHGVAALSVLTDETFFQGRLRFIHDVKQAVPLPVLRKDFLIDEYQVFEARAAEADAILLIAEVLDAARIADLIHVARGLDMAILVEVYTRENLSQVVDQLGTTGGEGVILGINNRNLNTQKTDPAYAMQLADGLPDGTPFVVESGIASREDVLQAGSAGAWAVLVGESLLRAPDIGAKVDVLLGKPCSPQ